jgi:hypothetical protein
MSGSALPIPDPPDAAEPSELLARLPANASPILPINLEPARTFAFSASPPRPGAPEPAPKTPTDKVLRSLKDLQQLQKQTIVVLEAVQGSLEDIHQVLRSPEATRGHEKQKNAATLLAKGFPREAVDQAAGAVVLLPANPEAHLLLALSLAADQQFDASLAATRKGLALMDRRVHPLAVEAGLLHALASLGCAAEAVERWSLIIDALPLPVLLEQTGRIAACFPHTQPDAGDSTAGKLLDTLLSARLQQAKTEHRQRKSDNLRNTAPAEIPPAALFAGLDACESLPLTHRAILGQIAHRLAATASPADILKFLTECIIPLAERGLSRSATSLAKASIKRLLRFHADAPTLYRAMTKLQLASAAGPARDLAKLLLHWRKVGQKAARAKRALVAASAFFLAGIALLAVVLFRGPAQSPAALFAGPAFIALAILASLLALFTPARKILLPDNRPPLTPEELHFLRPAAIRHALRSAARSRSV